MLKEIKQALKDSLDSIDGLNTFNYYDNQIDISSTQNVNNQNEIVEGQTSGIILTGWNEIIEDNLVRRYIKYNGKLIKIIDQSNIDYSITIAEPLVKIGEGNIPSQSKLQIYTLDSCYIENNSIMSAGGTNYKPIKRVRINLKLKTKQDSSGDKISDYADKLVSLKELNESRLSINFTDYNSSTNMASIRFVGDIMFNDITDKDNDLKQYLISFLLEYRTRTTKI